MVMRHGGKRPGSGRRPKGYKSPTAIGEVKAAPVPAEIEVAAEVYVPSSLKALINQLTNGAGDQARVRAANLILDRGYGAGRSPARPLTETIRSEAREHALTALEVLHRIAEGSESEGARVSAAASLLDRALGSCSAARVPSDVTLQLGKREQAVADARAAATGVFAVPAAPGAPRRKSK